MNSFWIPKLGGQVYAMSGMSSQLHLMASQAGSFEGHSANISGRGFAGMNFITKATSQADFDKWVSTIKSSKQQLTLDEYNRLSQPSENNTTSSYTSPAADLYDHIIMKYMQPDSQMTGQTGGMGNMEHNVYH
jgi:cytochrome o ubiquinol oxidase subunit 2